jgi:hypothetical protein
MAHWGCFCLLTGTQSNITLSDNQTGWSRTRIQLVLHAMEVIARSVVVLKAGFTHITWITGARQPFNTLQPASAACSKASSNCISSKPGKVMQQWRRSYQLCWLCCCAHQASLTHPAGHRGSSAMYQYVRFNQISHVAAACLLCCRFLF